VDTWAAGLLLFMSKSQPDIRIRHAVATWPDDSPRGAVTAFCRKHNVSRAWFYRVRAAAAEVGPVKALEKRPTLPSTMPTMTAPAMIDLLLGAREELKELGLDHGPLSVMAKLSRQGFRPPSRATVARIFARAGVVVPRSWEPTSNWAKNTSERPCTSSTTTPPSCSSEHKAPKSSATPGPRKEPPTSATANPQASQPTPEAPERNGPPTRRSNPATQRHTTNCPHSHETATVHEVLSQEVSTRS
jgi:hypothetical protein